MRAGVAIGLPCSISGPYIIEMRRPYAIPRRRRQQAVVPPDIASGCKHLPSIDLQSVPGRDAASALPRVPAPT
eukprot:SAG11_NODE_2636_length_3149_cov_1.681639_3_plen_73_part_00